MSHASPRREQRSLLRRAPAWWLMVSALLVCSGCRQPSDSGTRFKVEAVPEPDLGALTSWTRERLQGARVQFEERLARPGLPPIGQGRAYGELGLVYHAYDLMEAAAVAYRNARGLDPKNYRWPHLLGVLQAGSGELTTARRSLEEAILLRPTDVSGLVLLGEVERELGMVERASERFARARELDPSPAPRDPLMAHVAALRWSEAVFRARRAMQEGQMAEAVQIAEQALEESPEDANLHLILSTALAKMGREQEAVHHFEEILRVSDDPVARKSAHLNLAVKLDSEGNTAGAVGHFRDAVAIDPDDKQVTLALALELQKLARYEEAAVYSQRAARLDPTMAPAWYALARNLALAGEWQEAREALEEVQDWLRDNPVFMMRLSRVLAAAPNDEVRDGARALEYAERSYERGATAEAHETLAMALAELGRYQEAIDFQQRAIAQVEGLDRPERLSRLQSNLLRYQQGRACRDPAI